MTLILNCLTNRRALYTPFCRGGLPLTFTRQSSGLRVGDFESAGKRIPRGTTTSILHSMLFTFTGERP
jgi:hypothetical protein